MTITRSVLGAAVGMQSLAVLGRAAKMIPKETTNSRRLQNQPKNMVKGFTEIMIGTALIKPTANIVSTL